MQSTTHNRQVAHPQYVEARILAAADRRRATRAIALRWWYSPGAWVCARRLRRSARAIERGAS